MIRLTALSGQGRHRSPVISPAQGYPCQAEYAKIYALAQRLTQLGLTVKTFASDLSAQATWPAADQRLARSGIGAGLNPASDIDSSKTEHLKKKTASGSLPIRNW